jgi:tartrate dehydratase alpha subunit/fumarate hydratase class I-like protein
MSLYSSMSPKAIEKRMNRDQSTGAPLPLRTLLETRIKAAQFVIRGGGSPLMIATAELAIEQAEEQLTLLDAIDFGYIVPILEGGTIPLNWGKS